MSYVERSITLSVPVNTAYNQWTQFEDFPKFMEGVKEVKQLNDNLLHWRAEIAGKEVQWDAEIIEQVPDKRIAWSSTTGAANAGVVKFIGISNERSRLTLRMEYDPKGLVENIGSAVNIPDARIAGDLKRFKHFIETQGSSTGAWRGTIEGGHDMRV